MPLTATLVATGASALGKIGVGIGQLLGADKKEKDIERPVFDIQQEYFTNRDIAARMAQGGLTDEALQFYGDQAGRGLATTTSAILQGGGGVNAAAGAYDTYLQGVRSIAAEDSQLQTKNILTYLDRNDTLAKQKVQKWVIDKYEPYKDATKAVAQQRASGFQNLFTGASEGVAGAASYSMSKNYEDLLEGMGNRESAGNAGGTPAGNTGSIYYTDKPSSAYGDFVDPYEVKPVEERRVEVAKKNEATGFDPTIFDEELQEYYRRLYKTN